MDVIWTNFQNHYQWIFGGIGVFLLVTLEIVFGDDVHYVESPDTGAQIPYSTNIVLVKFSAS